LYSNMRRKVLKAASECVKSLIENNEGDLVYKAPSGSPRTLSRVR
jgi:hypothetical protein